MSDSIINEALNQTLKCQRLQSKLDKIELDSTAYMLFFESWLDPEESIADLNSEILKSLREKWITQWLQALKEEHCGDCTKMCGPCTRCGVENLYDWQHV